MKFAILCSALALSFCVAATATAGGHGQKYSGGHYGGAYHSHYYGPQGGYAGQGYGCAPYGGGPYGGYGGHGAHGGGYGSPYGAFGVPAVAPPAYMPGPPSAAVTYPYYTVRGPRDFLMANPPPLGP